MKCFFNIFNMVEADFKLNMLNLLISFAIENIHECSWIADKKLPKFLPDDWKYVNIWSM